jgi:hypothetical protein
MTTIEAWLAESRGDDAVYYVKRLSGNDTGLTCAHQVGLYLPVALVVHLCPDWAGEPSPSLPLPMTIDSEGEAERELRLVWYNEKSRNEGRLTRWGGAASPVQDPERTGALIVLAFHKASPVEHPSALAVWICQGDEDESAVEAVFGTVEPGQVRWTSRSGQAAPGENGGSGANVETRILTSMPDEWRVQFPTGADVLALALALAEDGRKRTSDELLLHRRRWEFEVFQTVERLHVLPCVRAGFPGVDEFLLQALAVTNRRKARAGRSLELHLARIFTDCRVSYEHGGVSELNKRPDFLFPHGAYASPLHPPGLLRMLAVKTTCKDRWRQVLNEADRIPQKHLFTLQEGVSLAQLAEMEEAGLKLVVPQANFSKFPVEVRDKLTDLSGFVCELRALGAVTT